MIRVLAFCLSLLVITGPQAALAQGTSAPLRTIIVSGMGEVTATPDIATLSMGVEVTRARSSAAMADLSNDIADVFDVLQDAGIEARDLQTSGLSLSPIYEQLSNGRRGNRITGYSARSSLSVRVRDLARVGVVIDAVANAGANRFQGISFSIDQTDALMDEARRRAALNAKARAELYAEALGVTLGDLLQVQEAGAASPRPMQVMAMAEPLMESRSMPVAAGESSLSASVTLTYAIGE